MQFSRQPDRGYKNFKLSNNNSKESLKKKAVPQNAEHGKVE
jgi:hypothetical protein